MWCRIFHRIAAKASGHENGEAHELTGSRGLRRGIAEHSGDLNRCGNVGVVVPGGIVARAAARDDLHVGETGTIGRSGGSDLRR